ncbi:MAG TPA: hypothetical protein DIT99_09055 [Candidatus Latescibacteria bacterium]|nr:hypothetical protein [Candidatus Latescibacterota bacterium]
MITYSIRIFLVAGVLVIWFLAPASAQIYSKGARTEFLGGVGLRTFLRIVERGRLLQGSDEIPDPLNRSVSVRVTPVVTVYGLTRSFSLIGIGPFRNRRFERTVGGSRLVDESFGIGDVSLLGKYRLYRKNAFQARRVVSAEVGVKLPTGRNNERDAAGGLLPPASAPGKCPITGVVFW